MVSIKSLAVAAAVATGAMAQRPTNTSICDYYTTALLMNNTAANQYTLLTLVVNTAVIGNYTQPNVGIAVPGILAKGTYNGTAVNLLPYFNGQLASTNRNGSAVAVNFLNDGGATPLMMNMPSNGTSSAQYKLLTHLYQYFGTLLGCSMQSNSSTAFPSYQGSGSQYNVHKFMALSNAEVGYFIQQVGLAAASFGVAQADVTAVGTALTQLFDYRCAPPTVVVPSQPAALQAICIASDCPISPNATCASYDTVVRPSNATANNTVTSTSGTSNGTTASGTSASGVATARSGAATGMAVALPVLGAGLLAAML